MLKPSWGTKRACPGCSAHFYDLNKVPAHCPKCNHNFDPAMLVRGRKKSVKRTEKQEETAAKLLERKTANANAKRDKLENPDRAGGISDIAEMEDGDEIENLEEFSELEELEESAANDDDADDESIIEKLNEDESTLVGNVEDEEAEALERDLEDDEAPKKKKKKKASDD